MKSTENVKVGRKTIKELGEELVRQIIETTKLDIDVEKCLLVMEESQTRINLNKTVELKTETIVNRNGKNEEIFLRCLAEIFKGFTCSLGDDGIWWLDENKIDSHIEYEYKNRVIKATMSSQKITRKVIEIEESM